MEIRAFISVNAWLGTKADGRTPEPSKRIPMVKHTHAFCSPLSYLLFFPFFHSTLTFPYVSPPSTHFFFLSLIFFKQQEIWSPSFLGVFRKHVHTWLTAPVLSRHQPYNSCSSGQQQRPPVLMPGRIKWSII